MITKDLFGKYDRYTLSNEELEVSVITLGATVTSLKFKGEEKAICYQSAEAAEEGAGFLCKTVGRYANRIGNAAFQLEGKRYELPANEGKNQLHGGPNSYDKRVWNAEVKGESVCFSIFSPDGDNGFPGNFTMRVTFSLEGGALRIDFGGETDKTTVYAPTVHPYFNLGGTDNVLEGKLQVNAAGHLEVDEGLIPTGVVLPCEGKFDFAQMRVIGENFDDCFVTPGEHACTLEMGSFRMEVWTDFPAIQIYTGISMAAPYKNNQGIAIEPEAYPDSPNHANFPSTVLRPGEQFKGYVAYKFSEI